ncbi:transposase [Acinetobacter sp. B5B]|uniref:RNA-guided endonuclease InsQ/TnpB family protein n=1 Tax=Acinetobacter baretiae TaxID=2605383 RepID=UPI0018C26AB6|nr:RNA-guided endonuclease TnpB family protein [Acinetobacter baretiae]MBF7682654.1 transposase [Acinetobacter baretiae]
MSRIIRGQVIKLSPPNNKQATYFAQASGVARLAYNWALAEWQKQYQQDKDYRELCKYYDCMPEDRFLNHPHEAKLRKQLNATKRIQYPFMLDVTKCAPQLAIKQLGDAFKRFFKGEAKYPQFRKKGIQDRFSLSNDQFSIHDKKIRIPNLGWVRMAEKLRYNGKILSAKIFKQGNQWFASIAVELLNLEKLHPKTGRSVGVDLGVKDLAILSNGEVIKSVAPLKAQLSRLKRLNQSLSRKKKGSQNRLKAKAKLSKLHYRISCVRNDYLHKLTSSLIKRFDVIAIEDLNTKGMMKNRKLSRVISDMGFYEFKRQLIYKAVEQGKQVKSVGRFFPSSKTCSRCGEISHNLTLKDRAWTCICSARHDRDLNAAINILNHANKVLTAA